MQRVLAGLVVAVVVAAAARPVAADPRPALVVKLVAAGKGTLRPLRVAPLKGTKQTIVMTSHEAVAQGLRGRLPPPEQRPAIRVEIDLEVTHVKAGGDLRYDFVYRKVEVVEDKAKTDIGRRMNGVLGEIAGTKGHLVLTNRGVLKELDVVVPRTASPEVQEAIEGLGSTLELILQALPEEPVGVGARWETSGTSTADELTTRHQASHELVELAGTRGKIKVTSKQQGKGSGPANLTMAATAEGEIAFDLTRVVPMQARLELRTEVELDVDGKRLAFVKTSSMTVAGR